VRSLLPLLLLVAAPGCSRNLHTESAVRQGVLDHLASRDFNLASMDVALTNVIFRQDQADATISFAPKGSKGAGMIMRYTLQLQGNHWVVKGMSDAGGSPHSGGMKAPQPGAGSLPPGHPALPPDSVAK
jgi:hypothetical protein